MSSRNIKFLSPTDADFKQSLTDWIVEHLQEFSEDQLDKIAFLTQSELIERDQQKNKKNQIQ